MDRHEQPSGPPDGRLGEKLLEAARVEWLPVVGARASRPNLNRKFLFRVDKSAASERPPAPNLPEARRVATQTKATTQPLRVSVTP